MGWIGHNLFTNVVDDWTDPSEITVGLIDDKLRRGRPGSRDENIGFLFGDVVELVY